MKTRELGRSGVRVPMVGLGCMGMSEFYGPGDEEESIAVLHRALEIGVSFWDTADMYGSGRNETLVGKALRGVRDRVFLATKFGVVRDEEGGFRGVSGTPDYVKRACEASLKRLGVEHVDLYYLHRVDPEVPIEDTVGAMGELVREGKVRHLGLSEASPATIRRAVKVHPIAALQTEYSLWSRDVEDAILPTCRELGIGFVPYSPLGRGFLTGKIRSVGELAANDWRRANPRFQGEAFATNLSLLDRFRGLAAEKGCTPAQLALAWVLLQGRDVVPIPGTKRRDRLEENAVAAEIALSASDLARIEETLPRGAFRGERYPAASMKLLNG